MKKKYTKLFEWQQRAKIDKLHCCNCETTESITVDHIIPCVLIEQFFSKNTKEDNENRYFWLYENEKNFRYLCKYCGDKKSSKLDFKEPLTKQLLLELLEKV